DQFRALAVHFTMKCHVQRIFSQNWFGKRTYRFTRNVARAFHSGMRIDEECLYPGERFVRNRYIGIREKRHVPAAPRKFEDVVYTEPKRLPPVQPTFSGDAYRAAR